jgi:hypothetical protein
MNVSAIVSAVQKEQWAVRSDYGKENVFRVWEADTLNYHNDTSPEAMDARANLMQAAPELRAALILARGFVPKTQGALRARINAAIQLADEGR